MTAVVHGWNERARAGDRRAHACAARGRRPQSRGHLSRDAPMRAVVRLIWIYCAATPLQLGLLLLGLVCVVIGLTGYLYMPTWSLGTGMRSSPLWYQLAVLLCPWLGLILLFFASARLPTIVERLALGRSILVLPGGRVRVLLAAVDHRRPHRAADGRGRNADLLLLSERAKARARFFAHLDRHVLERQPHVRGSLDRRQGARDLAACSAHCW